MIMRGLFIFLSLNISCSSLYSLKKNPSDKELFKYALKLKKNSYYKKSISQFRKLKNQFLYSPLVKKADLAIADIYFAQEEWQKAALSYKNFSALYPNHPKTDSVLFYLFLSYFKQLPTTPDRDLKLSTQTLFYINKHLTLFPKSPFKHKTLKVKQKVLTLLAKKQWLVAYFHLKNERPRSAFPYMNLLIKKYSSVLPVFKKSKSLSAKTFINTDLPSLKRLKKEVRKIKKSNNYL